MDRGAWRAAVHGVAQTQPRLNRSNNSVATRVRGWDPGPSLEEAEVLVTAEQHPRPSPPSLLP